MTLAVTRRAAALLLNSPRVRESYAQNPRVAESGQLVCASLRKFSQVSGSLEESRDVA
jgi:hypothetical protein